MTITRRQTLKLAGISSMAAALQGALSAEGLAAAQTTAAPASPPALPFAVTTPMHVGEAALRVRDIKAMTAYYKDMLGLEEIAQSGDGGGNVVVLGAGGTPLLHLVHKPDAPFENPASAGLFHIAYLIPDRQDLARWLVHVARRRFPVTGFADHSVSEAIYLTDPEGNGVEVYWDRPRDLWKWDGDTVTMGTNPLDVDDIVATTDIGKDSYTTAPDNLRIGHIHLRVGEVAQAAGFYGDLIGLSSTRGSRADAGFFSSGHYHHHVAFNIWNSAGAGPRDEKATGLDWFSLKLSSEAEFARLGQKLKDASLGVSTANGYLAVPDPWGTHVRLLTA
jgi:catechol 2,3-dioxygenase